MIQYPFFFTWTEQRSAQPVNLRGGDGSYLITEDGERWLDLGSLSYQANLGHGNRRIIDAIHAQAEALCLAMPNAVYPAKAELARRLLELAPDGFSKVFFTLSGAEATENAIKMARLVTRRHKLVSRYRSYHGASMGAITLSGDWRRAAVEPGLPGIIHAMDCYCDRCPFGQTLGSCATECAQHIEQILDLEGPGSVAAVVLEPIVGANGVLIPPPDYWPRIRAACDRHGTLLIADEVLTGFGRTGPCFAVEHFDVVPDMITLAKAVTGGYAPLGAVLVHERVAEHFDAHMLACGLTNYAHPLGCAAGLAALDEYRDRDLFTRAAALHDDFMKPLYALRERLPGKVAYVRGIGLLAAIELGPDFDASAWSRFAENLQVARLMVHGYPKRNTVVLAPALDIDPALLRDGMGRFADALERAAGS